MAVQSASVTVATTATALNAVESTGSDRASVKWLLPAGSVTVYIGGSDVTTGTGFPYTAGQADAVNNLAQGEIVYACVASGTQAINVLRSGVG